MVDITVRQAVLTDLDALTSLFDAYRQFYGKPSDVIAARCFLRARFTHGESVLFLARNEDKKAIGFTQLYPSFSSTAMARIFVLNDLYVAPEARGSGAGQRLLRAAADYASSVGAVRLTLSTALDNLTAQSVYEANGWKRDDQFYVYNLPLNAA